MISPRFVGAIAVLLALVTCGQAKADTHPTESEAYGHCNSDLGPHSTAFLASQTAATTGAGYKNHTLKNVLCKRNDAGGYYQEWADVWANWGANNTSCNPTLCKMSAMQGSQVYNHNFTTACPAGSSPGDPPVYACITAQQKCLNKNDARQTSEIRTAGQCIDGCMYGARPNLTGETSVGTSKIVWGQVGFTGDTCTSQAGDPLTRPPQKDQECLSGPTQLTVCVKKTGEHCYNASTGKQICWKPGETGTKTDGNVAQVRKPGPPPVAPPTPPEGETFNDAGKPTTTNTKTPNGTTNTTTTNNFTTGNGTDAGDSDDGETPGEEPGDEDEGTAGGGEGCDAPPTCSGDNIGCAALVMTWRVRCSEGRNKITGGVECGANGAPILVCAGDQVMCRQTLLDSEQVCRARKADSNGDGQPDWTKPGEGDGTENAGEEPGEDVGKVHTASFGTPVLDETGLAWSRSCPDLGSVSLGYFGSFDFNSVPWFCDFTAIVRATLFLVGSFLALMIVMGWRQ